MNQGQAPRDRTVVLLMGFLVALVLIVNVLSALLPGMDAALASLPLVVLLLIGGTVLVLARAIRR